MSPNWKSMLNIVLPLLMAAAAVSLVISKPTQETWSRNADLPTRQGKTVNMSSMGMNMFKDMFQNGIPFRPLPPPFPSLKNLFKVNGTHLTWVPLGSLIFNNNGKIIGG